jgi:predicted tellurium resistance membrane protein TerC
MQNLLSLETLGSLLSLAALETVLGIDNIIFLSILVGKLPRSQQTLARRMGLVGALGMRILLLLTLTWLASLTKPFFHVAGHPISGRDLVLIVGGGFLIFKSTWEIFGGLESEDPREDQAEQPGAKEQARRNFVLTLIQIVLMDIVFSLDSVITAVGIAPFLGVMIAAMFLSMLVMLWFAGAIGDFVNRHPSMKVLALSFLILSGTLLVAEGGGQKIPKGYVYASMAFAFTVELLNLWLRKRAQEPTELHDMTRHARASSPGPEPVAEAIGAGLPDAERVVELERTVTEQKKRIADLEAKLGA